MALNTHRFLSSSEVSNPLEISLASSEYSVNSSLLRWVNTKVQLHKGEINSSLKLYWRTTFRFYLLSITLT